MELELKDGANDLDVDLLEEASNFIFRVLDGAAIQSHDGALVPECPGLDGPDRPCGSPVHKASAGYQHRARQ
jgi:hypothetical protein